MALSVASIRIIYRSFTESLSVHVVFHALPSKFSGSIVFLVSENRVMLMPINCLSEEAITDSDCLSPICASNGSNVSEDTLGPMDDPLIEYVCFPAGRYDGVGVGIGVEVGNGRMLGFFLPKAVYAIS